MTASLPFTEAGIKRAVRAVQRAGLPVKAVVIGPDGSIVVHSADAPALAPVGGPGQDTKWGTPRA